MTQYHMKYITKRIPSPNVDLNIDSESLCGCDCIDNCEDKNKCSCWQLTNEGTKNHPASLKDHDNIGYSFKRLHKKVLTGIYECNASCKCKKTCLNRVVQEPLKTSLQLFFTKKKGWGVRTLADIPKGSFVCTYLGVVRPEKDTDADLLSNRGEYLADLNFVEIVEDFKDGYESNEVYVDENEDSTSSSDNEKFNPGWAIKSKVRTFESRMSLRKNLQNTNTKIDGKHELSKLNTQQKVESKKTFLQDYIDKEYGFYTLDSKVCGNIGRYFNHSCDPNIFIQNVFIDTHDLRLPWLSYFAKSNIPAGTELAWDYNYMIGSVKNKRLMCHCGSKKCRGRLL
ncbi:histone-lysine N-methyltransferase eggless-like [Acyrthosiphon pisum]|uniref:Histone-lysine N-methyltransferase n=1 Tax=Acyrthosiphon pisum TaxID=7029 RepID=A0A8R2H8V5_ACYPI|nr:histone-lysine N-methyltransferase eggless-like [Acyrthosiphon pisum]|eukprot:XP_016661217.1 PREDICTED: histone-lysine N-methyltransferase eggless-like [Acyrthosiphon pisum]